MASRLRPAYLLLLGLLAVVPAAAAPAAAAQGLEATPQVKRVLGPDTTLRSNGLYKVDVSRGEPLLTHGPDPQPPAELQDSPAQPEGEQYVEGIPSDVGFGTHSIQREPVCADTNSQQVLYAHLAGTVDRLESFRSRIQAQIRKSDAVLNAESLDSGGPSADYRVRCDAAGGIDVASFTSTGSSMSEIVTSARAAGYGSTSNDYMIFVDAQAGGTCGVASMQGDDRLAADNRNNSGGGYAVAYQGCWFQDTPMHEMAHTMGAVQYGAPNSTGGGHCYDEDDIMCYSDGGPLHPSGTVTACESFYQPRFDCNHDDYFDSAPEPGEYLETHWNLGSPLNAYLAFGVGEQDPYGEDGGRQQWRKMPVRVPHKAKSLAVSLHGPGDLTLYVRRRRAPTEKLFECRDRPTPGIEKCRLPNPHQGRWFIGVLDAGTKRPGRIQVKTKLERPKKADGPRSEIKSRVWRPSR